MSARLFTMGLFSTLVSFFSTTPVQSQVIHQERSLYQNIAVVEKDGRRCLTFSSNRGLQMQSCQYEDQSDSRLYFPYTRMSFSGLLLNPNPKNILLVGLGGGSIPLVFSELYPDAKIDVVELDPAVKKIAYDYFHFRDTVNMSVTISDARVFIKRAGMQGKQYDYILLDAFNGDYIPEHLMTKEFLQETKRILSDKGVLVANTFSSSKLYDHESVTYQEAFGSFLNFKYKGETTNRVIITSKSPLPSQESLQNQADRLTKPLARYGIQIEKYPPLMSLDSDWDTSVRVLTDQFSPVNLLKE